MAVERGLAKLDLCRAKPEKLRWREVCPRTTAPFFVTIVSGFPLLKFPAFIINSLSCDSVSKTGDNGG